MAMTPSTGFMIETMWTSTLASKLDKIDCSQVLAAVLKGDRELLGHIKMGPPAHNIQVDWIEDSLNPCTFEAYSAEVSTTMTLITSFSSTASVQNIVREGAIIAPFAPANASGADFLLEVTSVHTTTGIDTAQGAYGSTVWTTVDTTTTWLVVAQPKKDTDDASSDISLARTKRSNFMQVFERGLAITQTRKNMDMEAVSNELQLQVKRRTMEIKRELNNAVILGIPTSSGGAFTADSNLRTMMGLVNYIRDPDLDRTREHTTCTSNSAGALTVQNINDLCYKIYGEGGLDDTADPIIVVGPYQQRIISTFEKGGAKD